MKRALWALLALTLLAACSQQSDERFVSIAEGRVYQVPALATGRVTQMFVDEGQSVNQGDVIAVIDTLAMHYQIAELKAGLAELAATRAVQQTQIAQSRKDLAYIDERLRRNDSLVDQNALPAQTRDDLANTRDKAQSQLEAAQRQLDVLSARKTQLEARQAQLRKSIADAVVIAPADGVISARYVRQGEAAAMMRPVVEITSLAEIETTIYIPEAELPQTSVGQSVSVRLDGYNRTLTGHITWISPKSEFTPKQVLTPDNRSALVYAAHVLVSNPDGLIKHGMPVEVIR